MIDVGRNKLLMTNNLPMHVHPLNAKDYEINVNVSKIGCSRNADRDIQATQKSIDGIRKAGSKMHGPAGICFKSRYLLTNENAIEVQGPHTSGEIEFVVFTHSEKLYVTVGSDHNDRSLDPMWTELLGRIKDTAKSKQMVPAVTASEAWLYDDVKDHWDEIILKSRISVSGKPVDYQQFALINLLNMDYYKDNESWILKDGSVLLGGSGPMLSSVPNNIFKGQDDLKNITFPIDFHIEISDPVLGRTISHKYDVLSLEALDSFSL